MLISTISEYQISNVQCFEYPMSNQLHLECQIADAQDKKNCRDLHSDAAFSDLYLPALHVEYKKTVQIYIGATAFWVCICLCYIKQIHVSRYRLLTMRGIKAKYTVCLFHQYVNAILQMASISNIQKVTNFTF